MESIFNTLTTNTAIFLILGVSLLAGIITTFIVSIKFRASKGFFITNALLPMVVAVIVCLTGLFLSSASSITARLVTIAVALGLIRFRSAQGRADEMLLLFASVAAGFGYGTGYVLYTVIFHFVLVLLYLLFAFLPVWNNSRFSNERLLKITIPETLDYVDVFDETFKHYLKSNSLVEVKTTGMGSLFRLSYKIEFKNPREEKEFIDELRTKNGNLEISIVPFVEPREM